MIKKNTFQRRFNTAGARIAMSNKLPSDFFHPNLESKAKETSLWSRSSNRPQECSKIFSPKAQMQFTFHRSCSEDKMKMRSIMLQRIGDDLISKFGVRVVKLPPVSFKINKENEDGVKRDRVKKLGKINSRMLYETSLMKQRSGDAK